MNQISLTALQAQSKIGEGGVTETPRMTRFAFQSRLTLEEDVALEIALPTNPLLRVALRRFSTAGHVDVSLPETQELVTLLSTTLRVGEAEGGATIIAPNRVSELLALKPIYERGAINPITEFVTP